MAGGRAGGGGGGGGAGATFDLTRVWVLYITCLSKYTEGTLISASAVPHEVSTLQVSKQTGVLRPVQSSSVVVSGRDTAKQPQSITVIKI